jgi:hypothetical protein
VSAKAQREVLALLSQAKRLAKRYYALTGRPLGVTGELAEYEAVRHLGLLPAVVRQPGYDAERMAGGRRERLQIKGRCIIGKLKPGAKLGKIDVSKPCSAVLLVLLNEDFDATVIYRAEWEAVRCALTNPGL